MTFDLHEILASKSAYRRKLASRDIVEKLAMLDAMRERAITLRGSGAAHAEASDSSVLHEDPSAYRAPPS